MDVGGKSRSVRIRFVSIRLAAGVKPPAIRVIVIDEAHTCVARKHASPRRAPVSAHKGLLLSATPVPNVCRPRTPVALSRTACARDVAGRAGLLSCALGARSDDRALELPRVADPQWIRPGRTGLLDRLWLYRPPPADGRRRRWRAPHLNAVRQLGVRTGAAIGGGFAGELHAACDARRAARGTQASAPSWVLLRDGAQSSAFPELAVRLKRESDGPDHAKSANRTQARMWWFRLRDTVAGRDVRSGKSWVDRRRTYSVREYTDRYACTVLSCKDVGVQCSRMVGGALRGALTPAAVVAFGPGRRRRREPRPQRLMLTTTFDEG